MKTFRKGGIHPHENKLTAGKPVEELALPAEVTLLTGQHIGAPAKPIVKKGDEVMRGQMVAEPGGFVSAAVHSPVHGIVTAITTVKDSRGLPVEAITIKTDAENPRQSVEFTPCADAAEAARRAGIVGLGGATFPAPVKLTPPKDCKIDTLVINGAECEPYLTCDDALMRLHADEIIAGAGAIMDSLGISRCLIGIEANKPEAISRMKDCAAKDPRVEIVELRPRYPQGGEKQLIEALTGRRVPAGALPAAVGVIVQNVATVRAIHRAVAIGEPLMERIVTVSGRNVERPGNYLVAFGTPLSALAEAAGGVPDGTTAVIAGGPMMGKALASLDSFTTKGLSGLLMLPDSELPRREPEPCIRCARCVSVCPMGLEPYLLSTYARLGMTEDAVAAHVTDCIECGSCSYVCPSSRPLIDYIRLGKQKGMALLKSQKK